MAINSFMLSLLNAYTLLFISFKNKGEGCFVTHQFFSAEFPDIARFCRHPELLLSRKINWDNRSSLMRVLCSMICLNILCDRLTELLQNRWTLRWTWVGFGVVKVFKNIFNFFVSNC